MHLDTLFDAILHHRHVARDDRRDACLASCIHDLVHRRNVAVVDNRVHRQIGFHTLFATDFSDFAQVVDGEMIGRVRPHIQLSDTEINRVGTSLDGRCQRVA